MASSFCLWASSPRRITPQLEVAAHTAAIKRPERVPGPVLVEDERVLAASDQLHGLPVEELVDLSLSCD